MRAKAEKAVYASNSDEWETPGDLFEKLDAEFGFDLDPCATEANHKCKRFFTKEENGLLQKWGGVKFSAILRTPRLING